MSIIIIISRKRFQENAYPFGAPGLYCAAYGSKFALLLEKRDSFLEEIALSYNALLMGERWSSEGNYRHGQIVAHHSTINRILVRNSW